MHKQTQYNTQGHRVHAQSGPDHPRPLHLESEEATRRMPAPKGGGVLPTVRRAALLCSSASSLKAHAQGLEGPGTVGTSIISNIQVQAYEFWFLYQIPQLSNMRQDDVGNYSGLYYVIPV